MEVVVPLAISGPTPAGIVQAPVAPVADRVRRGLEGHTARTAGVVR